MAEESSLTGLARRQRVGSEKRQIGIRNIARMLPGTPNGQHGGNAPPNMFAPDIALLAMEDSYCDVWDRLDVVDARTRSIFNVSLMAAVGNVGNQFELGWHAPGAIYNGVTVAELEAIVVIARAYVGSPASGWAMQSICKALAEGGHMPSTFPPPNTERRELKGSEKRAIARDVLHKTQPASPLLNAAEELRPDVFGAELDHMVLESVYYDLWSRADGVAPRTRAVIVYGLLMGLGNHEALADFIPVALLNGLTVPELEELLYQAAVYLGFPTGLSLRATIAAVLKP